MNKFVSVTARFAEMYIGDFLELMSEKGMKDLEESLKNI